MVHRPREGSRDRDGIDLGREVEIGMGCMGDPFRSYGRFLKYFFGPSKRGSRKVFGFIPRTFVEKKVSENVALIGDSTGGEPLMGSSIHKSIDEARLVSDAVKKVDLGSYEKLWNERFSAEFAMQQKVRDRLDSMNDSEIDNFFSVKRQLKSGGLVNDVFRDLLEK
jgi:flavin-dependent dehydrogenase